MSNLGDSNTPVEGESFGLPAGAELGEDNGDLVIQDSGGSIILRRDETNAEWQFENTDLTGINSIDASSATLGQVDGGITSDPITSLTDGELFVDSGTLTFTPSGGPDITWLQEGKPAVSVQLAGESVTVPNDEEWMVSLVCDGTFDVNGTQVRPGSGNPFVSQRTVFPAGTTINSGAEAHIQGVDISRTDLTTVGEVNPTVPAGETWVGGIVSEVHGINSNSMAEDSAYPYPFPWIVLDSGDSVSDKYDNYNQWFGGVVR